MSTKIATLLHFHEGVTEEQVKKLIEVLRAKGVLEKSHTGSYDPNWGEPVWYIP
jgi:hypothetical protein